MRPLVSVVIPTYRRPDLLTRCLDAVLAQQLPPPGFEVIVVDDDPAGSARPAVATAARDAADLGIEVRYATPPGPHGPAAARNEGWRIARSPLIAFTDDDCVPRPTWLAAGLAIMSREGLDGAAGRIVVPTPQRPTDYERTMANLEHASFPTANCFYRRDALERVGGFNERFTTAWREDSDLHFRLLDSGARLARADDAVVVHPVRRAPWGISLREQRKSAFNALAYRTNPSLYRRFIQPFPPLKYYATVLALLAAALGALTGRRHLLLGGTAAWIALTAEFAARRLRGTSHHPSHIAEMLMTSTLIPPLSIFWRIRGAIRYRVVFL